MKVKARQPITILYKCCTNQSVYRSRLLKSFAALKWCLRVLALAMFNMSVNFQHTAEGCSLTTIIHTVNILIAVNSTCITDKRENYRKGTILGIRVKWHVELGCDLCQRSTNPVWWGSRAASTLVTCCVHARLRLPSQSDFWSFCPWDHEFDWNTILAVTCHSRHVICFARLNMAAISLCYSLCLQVIRFSGDVLCIEEKY